VQWWEGEVERRHVLSKARVLFELGTLDNAMLPRHTPAFLQHRLAACVALPRVEVGEIRDQQAGEGAGEESMEGAWDGEEERAAVLGFVVGHLDGHLFREFMEATRPW
jgi:hypothetical protein